MTGSVEVDRDVIIMGGGPAGATLGALLIRNSNLRVALYEKETSHVSTSVSLLLIRLSRYWRKAALYRKCWPAIAG
jgi:2-polyprenyl-6-methoxyphenol hydroxylase-like FAD-dependent oxidoreductase